MWTSSDIGVYGFSMALNIDCPHNLGTLFYVKHLLSISRSQLCKVGPRLFSCLPVHHLARSFSVLGCCYSFPVFFFRESVHQRHFPAASVCSTDCLDWLDMVL